MTSPYSKEWIEKLDSIKLDIEEGRVLTAGDKLESLLKSMDAETGRANSGRGK